MHLTNPDSTIVSGTFDFAEIHLQTLNNHHLLISTKHFQPGEIISSFSASETHSQPSRYTVQTGENKHIVLHPSFLQYINHSCHPNSFFNTTTLQLEALKTIEPGEEFTFFYPSTEWFMAEPFKCFCGEANCIGTIRGAKELSREITGKYRFTDFIQSKLKQ